MWASDVNDDATVLGMSARNADGVVMGQEVLKLSPDGQSSDDARQGGGGRQWSGYISTGRPASRSRRMATSS